MTIPIALMRQIFLICLIFYPFMIDSIFLLTSKSKSANIEDAKSVALKTALHQIEATFGKGAVMRLGDQEHLDIPVISSGSLSLDKALGTLILPLYHTLGIRGFPRGRIVEIYGPESSGKTSLALLTIAEAQKNGGICTFIDAGIILRDFFL